MTIAKDIAKTCQEIRTAVQNAAKTNVEIAEAFHALAAEPDDTILAKAATLAEILRNYCKDLKNNADTLARYGRAAHTLARKKGN